MATINRRVGRSDGLGDMMSDNVYKIFAFAAAAAMGDHQIQLTLSEHGEPVSVSVFGFSFCFCSTSLRSEQLISMVLRQDDPLSRPKGAN